MTSIRLRPFRKLALSLLLVSTSASFPLHANEAYPAKQINLIVSLQVGSASDIASRVVAENLSSKLGIPVVVENIPGAGGILGASKLNGSKPDGYTIAALNNGLITLVPNLPQKPNFEIEALTPVSMISKLPSVLVVTDKFPAKTLKEFVARSKKRPGTLSYGSVGMGSPQHIAMEMLKHATGADLLHVPYRGGPQAVADVVSGQIQATWIAISVAAPFIKAGQLRALAVGGDKRSSQLPDTPTLSEAGVTEFQYVPWVALYAPPKTPDQIVQKLSSAIQEILGEQANKAKIASYGLEAQASTPDALAKQGDTERQLMSSLIKNDLAAK